MPAVHKMYQTLHNNTAKVVQYLGACDVEAGGVEAVFHLLRVVDVQHVRASKLDVVRLLAVLKVVHAECHLTRRATYIIHTFLSRAR